MSLIPVLCYFLYTSVEVVHKHFKQTLLSFERLFILCGIIISLTTDNKNYKIIWSSYPHMTRKRCIYYKLIHSFSLSHYFPTSKFLIIFTFYTAEHFDTRKLVNVLSLNDIDIVAFKVHTFNLACCLEIT